MIIYNKISNNNKVFGLDENKISILTKNKIKKLMQNLQKLSVQVSL